MKQQSRTGKVKIIKKIDRYEIRDEIGAGGMATVYYAFDPRVGREVAIKVLLKEFTHDPMFRQRFDREVQAIAALEHPAIVPVYDYGDNEEQPYLVMRYMSGGTLEDKLKIGALQLTEAGSIIARIGSALEQAHSRGIIHRDLKPGNVLFDQYGNAFLSDFGIVKLATGNKTLTEAGGMVGTPAYMSPEQVQGASNLDGRSDIYSLGVILYEMLSGVIPYNADTPMGVAVMQVTEPVPRIRTKIPNLPKKMETVISKSMAKKREDRYQNVGEMVEAILSVTGGDVKQMMESGTFPSAAAAAMGTSKAARPTNPNIVPTPRETVELAQAAAAAMGKPDTNPSKSTNPLPAPLNAIPVWALAAGGVVLLVIILGLILPGMSSGGGGGPTPTLAMPTEPGTQAAAGGATTEAPVTPTQPVVIPPTDAPGVREILFASDRLGNPGFFMIEDDGKDLSKILVDNANNRTPDWSPDGKKVAYRCQDASRKYICVINADGSGKQVLTSADSDNYAPSWSPDGKKIAYVSGAENAAEIYVMNADGSNPVRLTKNGSGDFDPTWSPDGSRIAFASNRPGGGGLTIWTMNVDGSNQVVLIKDGIPNYKPDWSPDGKSILFVSERDGNPEIYMMNSDGLNEKRLTTDESADVSPSWSPDGKKIVFSSRRDNNNAEVYVMNADGSSPTRVTNDPSDDVDPVWKP